MEQLDQYMRMMVWNGNPKSFIEADENVFPFEQVQKGSSVVLYAAGNVGRQYQSQIQRTGYCSLAAWVDKNWQVEELRKMGVESPDIITSITFDYVIVAIEKMEIAKQVRNELTDRGVQYSKIIIKVKYEKRNGYNCCDIGRRACGSYVSVENQGQKRSYG